MWKHLEHAQDWQHQEVLPREGEAMRVAVSSLQGWGFLSQDAGGPNLFFHSKQLPQLPEMEPMIGRKVRYESVWDDTRGSRKAQKLVLEA